VLRTGGTAGNLTVEYSTVDGTAIAGQDYSSAAGTLSFSGGETSKTLQIPIIDDATTEADETFKVELRSTASPESLGAPSTLLVTVQDRNTTPTLSITNGSVVEGNTGSTTEILFTINLSAATGRAISGNYTTTPISASGGTTCNNKGVDYESTSGAFSFQPGATTFAIPVRICGDSSAEANETFQLHLSNVQGATLLVSNGIGTIVNDDVLGLILEDSGPNPNQAAALDAVTALRDPFPVLGIPDWFSTGADKNTRVMLFAQNLQLNPGELPSAVTVRLTASNGFIFEVPAEDVRPLGDSEFTQVVFRLPNNLAVGTSTVFIRAHTLVSNSGTIRIVP
jgi:hypothetical protein